MGNDYYMKPTFFVPKCVDRAFLENKEISIFIIDDLDYILDYYTMEDSTNNCNINHAVAFHAIMKAIKDFTNKEDINKGEPTRTEILFILGICSSHISYTDYNLIQPGRFEKVLT